MSYSKRIFIDEFQALRKSYRPTKYPIVLCHGLFGFGKIKVPGIGDIDYWHGLEETLKEHGAEVISDSVPPAGSIKSRAHILYDMIANSRKLKKVNLIAHSMGGLDARYMISKLDPSIMEVMSLTTISTPHRGTPVADAFMNFTSVLPDNLGAFNQLTTTYCEQFNKEVQNNPKVDYFSYGARFKPTWASPLRIPWEIVYKYEGPNDGLVSVESAAWGNYQGTLENVDHWDLINLSSIKLPHLRNTHFSARAMYLYVMDQLAEKGF